MRIVKFVLDSLHHVSMEEEPFRPTSISRQHCVLNSVECGDRAVNIGSTRRHHMSKSIIRNRLAGYAEISMY